MLSTENHKWFKVVGIKISFEHADFWAKSLLFRTHNFWNSTTELTLMKLPTIFYRSNVFQTTGVLYLVTLQSLVSDFSPFYLTLSSFFSTTFSIGKKILNAKISYFIHIIINLFFYCRGNSPAEELIGEVADDSISNASNVSNDNRAWMW